MALWLKSTFCSLVGFTSRLTGLPEQFVSFLFVGVLNTLVGYGLYSFFVWVGFNYIWAPFFSTVLGILFNFRTIGVIVFQSHNNRLIGKFFGVYAIVYICNVLGLKGFAWCGVENMYISGAALVVPLALLSFILNKKWVFNK